MPEQITTARELDALPVGSVVRDGARWLWLKSGDGGEGGSDWQQGGSYGRPFPSTYLEHDLPEWPSTSFGPFEVLYRGEAGAHAPELFDAANDLVWLSEWIDAGNADRDPEAVTWGRLAKITEEAGEVIAAFIGMTGQNPRKGVTHTEQDVYDELLDVAVTALGAAEHLAGHQGAVLDGLLVKIHLVAERARAVHS